METIGLLTPDERAELQSLLPKNILDKHSTSAYHILLHDFNNSDLHQPKAYALAKRMLKKVFGKQPLLVSVRILVSHPGAPVQDWHLDYDSGRTGNLFVSLTKATHDNTTEYILFDDPNALELLMSKEGALSISQLPHRVYSPEVEPWTLLHLPAGTIHRRTENRSDYTRLTLAIDYTLEPEFHYIEADPSSILEAISPPTLIFKYD